MKEKYIGQALTAYWKNTTMPLNEYFEFYKKNGYRPVRTSLMYFLEYNYKERYVKLCNRVGVTPLSFGAWLRKHVESLT